MLDETQKRELAKPLDRATVKSRKQGGRDVSYIEGWHAIAEANRIFGFDGWTRETVHLDCVAQGPKTLGKPPNTYPGFGATYISRVRVTAHGVVREGCGTGHGDDRDLGHAHESALKEAETDAMKRALMTFGNPFGLALYDKTQADVIERLTKKVARPTYLSMLRELDELTSPRALQEWLNDFADAIKPLPDDWQASLRTVVDAKISCIRAGQEISPSGEILSDKWTDKQSQSLVHATQTHEPDEPQEVWTDDTPPEWDSAWDKLGPVKQAGVLCNDPAFWNFLSGRATGPVGNADQAADYVRIYCKVASRRDLATNPEAAKLWRALVGSYRAWQREPAVTDPVAPHRAPTGHSGDAVTERASADPPGAADAREVEESDSERIARLDKGLTDAAKGGWDALTAAWRKIGEADQDVLRAALNNRHKPAAREVDKAKAAEASA